MARCTDSTYDTREQCEAVDGEVWCTDSMAEPAEWVRCIDVSGTMDAVEAVVVVAVLVALLMTGLELTRRIVRAARDV